MAEAASVSFLRIARGGLPYIKVGVSAPFAGRSKTNIPGCVCVSMKAEMTDFDTRNVCPDCSADTSVVKLGAEPAREICGRLRCGWSGVTLQ